jgi:hypothetical protein
MTETIRLDSTNRALVITYNGRALDGLSLTKVMIWNAGRGSVVGNDIARTDPLTVKVGDDAEILTHSIEYSSSQAVSPIIENTAQGVVRVAFDVLNPTDGFVIGLVHTGGPGATAVVSGTVRDVRRLTRVRPDYGRNPMWPLSLMLVGILVVTFGPNVQLAIFILSSVAWNIVGFAMFTCGIALVVTQGRLPWARPTRLQAIQDAFWGARVFSIQRQK